MTDELCSLSRDLLMLKAAPKSGLSMLTGVCSDQEALALLERFSPAELLRITTLLQQTAAGFQKSANRRVDMELCLIQMCQPQLTTVEQPSRAIGRTAVDLLMKRIDDPDAAVERVMMDWRVIARASA